MSVSVHEMRMLDCGRCGGDVPVQATFHRQGETVTCPHCFAAHALEYDDCYDEESGDDYGWFYLVMGEPV